MRARVHHLPPDEHDVFIGDRTIVELKDADRIVVRMEADDPVAAAAALHRERELAAISPLPVAALDRRWLDRAFADPSQRVANDAPLGLQLELVFEMLNLTTATAVDPVV